jgi:hypothetical protein
VLVLYTVLRHWGRAEGRGSIKKDTFEKYSSTVMPTNKLQNALYTTKTH